MPPFTTAQAAVISAMGVTEVVWPYALDESSTTPMFSRETVWVRDSSSISIPVRSKKPNA